MLHELHWHPMIVHFPLALVLTACLCMVAARFVSREKTASILSLVGSWNLFLGAGTALIGVATGVGAAMNLRTSAEASHSISIHLYCAVVSTIALVFLAIWRGAGLKGNALPSAAFLVLLALASAALIVTGYFGGENVFRYGIGVLGH